MSTSAEALSAFEAEIRALTNDGVSLNNTAPTIQGGLRAIDEYAPGSLPSDFAQYLKAYDAALNESNGVAQRISTRIKEYVETLQDKEMTRADWISDMPALIKRTQADEGAAKTVAAFNGLGGHVDRLSSSVTQAIGAKDAEIKTNLEKTSAALSAAEERFAALEAKRKEWVEAERQQYEEQGSLVGRGKDLLGLGKKTGADAAGGKAGTGGKGPGAAEYVKTAGNMVSDFSTLGKSSYTPEWRAAKEEVDLAKLAHDSATAADEARKRAASDNTVQELAKTSGLLRDFAARLQAFDKVSAAFTKEAGHYLEVMTKLEESESPENQLAYERTKRSVQQNVTLWDRVQSVLRAYATDIKTGAV